MKTAIFDLDGTIANTIADLGAAVDYGLEVLGFPTHTIPEYKQFVGNGAMKLCERALPDGHKDLTEQLHGLFKEYYNVHLLDNTVLYDGIGDVIDTLGKNGVKLAVATNKPEDAAKKIIAKLLPDAEFVKILGGVEYRPKKPDTALISEILAELPDEGNEVWMIGDSNVDVQTGINAGIHVIGCAWGFAGRAELENAGADKIAEKAEDIVKYILNNNNT